MAEGEIILFTTDDGAPDVQLRARDGTVADAASGAKASSRKKKLKTDKDEA